MAVSRKLQGEIDRCLKKVTEGIETFDDIWQKVHTATNANQKEKYEADLKKEIKKLQRLRDQIKCWIASAEIKDKSNLLEYRRLIETQMERFKVIERETKTKAYSKEGLVIQKMDPAQREKEEIYGWLNRCSSRMNSEIENFESDIESLVVPGKKKRGDRDRHEKVEEMKSTIEKHKYHLNKLEYVCKLVSTMNVDIDLLRRLQEDLDKYLKGPSYYDNEYMYDELEALEDEAEGDDPLTGGSGETTPVSTTSPSLVVTAPVVSVVTTTSVVNAPIAVTCAPVAVTTTASDDKKKPKPNAKSGNNATQQNQNTKANTTVSAPAPTKVKRNNADSKSNNSSKPQSAVSSTPGTPTKTTTQITTVTQSGAILPKDVPTVTIKYNTKLIGGEFMPIVPHNSVPPSNNASSAQQVQQTQQPPPPDVSNVVVSEEVATPPSIAAVVTSSTPSKPTPVVNANSTNAVDNNVSVPSAVVVSPTISPSLQSPPPPQQPVLPPVPTSNGPLPEEEDPPHPNVQIGPLLGVAPLGSIPLTAAQQEQFRMMEAANNHLPHASDSERLAPYFQKNPCKVPPYYPTISHAGLDVADFYSKLNCETLFLIFYLWEGTTTQYLAAKALKKQSWRFHTKYMMWFQRHEEPRIINEEFEQGTYVYFDYEKWTQRKKEGFTFEYKYLEDKELP